MKLLANNSYGFLLKDLSRHTVTKFLNDEKTQSVINSGVFKRLNRNTAQLCEVELVKCEIEQWEQIIIEFYIVHFAKRDCWKLTTNYSKIFVTLTCMKNLKSKQTTFSCLSEGNSDDVILLEKRDE